MSGASGSPMNRAQSEISYNRGRALTSSSSAPARWARALDHGQSSGRARTGLRLTDLAATQGVGRDQEIVWADQATRAFECNANPSVAAPGFGVERNDLKW